MNANDVLRRLRYALRLSEPSALELFRLGGAELSPEELSWYLKREEEDGYVVCPDETLQAFLDGLIVKRRGPREDSGGAPPRRPRLDNNGVLRSLRIALELKDEDFIAIMSLAKVDVSKSEVNALFRKKDHSNYRACGDQFLRYFLNGLTERLLGRSGPSANA